jgi:acyl-coenzyme A synthetase/AMP-(fatty) acid ligase
VTINAAALLVGERDPARIALACGGETVTYGALRERVSAAASAWRALGVADGDRVAIALPDDPAWVVAYLGLIWAGGVAVAVNPRIPSDDWRCIVGEAGFRCILAAGRMPPADFNGRELDAEEWERIVAGASPMAPRPMDEGAPAFWSHSSGTSGRPKAVVHAHRFAHDVARVSDEVLGVRSDDRLYACSRMFFVYPLGNSLFAGLRLGATVVLDPRWPTPLGVAETIDTMHPTVFFGVPSMFRDLVRDGLAPAFARSRVRACVSAGEPLPAALREAWHAQAHTALVDGYGASETLCLVLVDRGEGDGFVPAPGVAITPAATCADDSPTRIRIRAPTLALGYWKRPDAEAQHFRDGAFHPADLFRSTPSGAWRFAGREDSLVKVHGRWVDLVELEERLAAGCPGIAEAAAVAVTDADGIATVEFFYVLKADAPPDVPALLGMFAATLPAYQRPRSLHRVPTLPRTPTGKLLRRRLAAMAESG